MSSRFCVVIVKFDVLLIMLPDSPKLLQRLVQLSSTSRYIPRLCLGSLIPARSSLLFVVLINGLYFDVLLA